ncbi:HNH endonuclease [Leisingera sp. XS_AS12]|uniref:HNH endonuclease n=1 Tax=Leisingera sp. XS_AS12 TaxID=3241294 RepID=UPI00351510ED
MNRNLDALVLNADFRPVTSFPLSTLSFEKTAKAVFLGRVTVVEEYDVELRSSNSVYRPASVVALKTYAKTPRAVPFTRMNIFLRDEFRCQYCGGEFSSKDLTFDHVVPRHDGGLTSWENIASACGPCNSRKGHRQDIKPIRMPKEPTPREMIKLRRLKPENFHRSWHDYLYWSGVLERDD